MSVQGASVEQAVAAIARGETVVVLDDEGRENEGDLILAADAVTPEKIAFFVRHTSGLICCAISEARADELELPLMVARNTESQRTAFAVTVDAAVGTTTGISASDRAATVRCLADPSTRAQDLARPGHVHVLRARAGGVLRRAGHTEAAVDLARLAGREPVGVLAEVVSADGLSMARGDELEAFAAHHGLLIVTIADLVAYRRRSEGLVRRVAMARLPTSVGEFTCYAYESLEGETHLALVIGELHANDGVLVRLHSECLTGDVLGSLRCDCGEQLDQAMARVAAAGAGVIVYLRGHEGRGIGIVDKLRAYELQDRGYDTVDANVELGLPVDGREYGIGAQILLDLGVQRVRLLTNNPAKRRGLEGFGVEVLERVPLETRPNRENLRYLNTKRARLGHLLAGPGLGGAGHNVG
ncbi:MAG: bifunctional 3,4-dihydroxy-2-butanone-4-phosphate synthase/GTP cyclohydrolase II [Actinomycetota bacterium]|nr:bifunctional 3,4-dihydroxy-2-butanone-4-phosphate synthase/GTP cyclohydrolase II [Actinomycetota bacterium]